MAITKYSFRRPAYTTWPDLDEVTNRLARFFEDPASFADSAGGHWLPAVSVTETADQMVLTAELPGLEEKDISVEIENNVLTLSGEKMEMRSEGDEDRRYHVWERRFGSFSRSFTLPRSVDGANIVATFEHGLLTVTLPKIAEAKGRKIEISK
jgi:HSP20 family protein